MYVEITNVAKNLKGTQVLKGITLSMEAGRVYGLKGRNGSGKTMLMRTICGLILPTEGEVKVDGKVLGKEISFPDSVGILIENPAFIGSYTGKENLKLLADIKGKIGVEEIIIALERVGLDGQDKRKYRKYSLGMKQRLGIAAAIMEHPKLLILDEPTNAIDENGVELLHHILEEEKERGAVIVLSCHDSEELEYLSDEIFQLSEGKLQKTEVR